jgi:tetratricopeptide (TPR) repeat protein
LEDFDAALETDDRATLVHLERSTARAMLGDTSGALDDLATVIELDPHLTEAYLDRSAILAKSGNLAEAQTDLEEVMRQETHPTYVYDSRGLLRWQLGDHAGAIEDFNQALEQTHASHQAYRLALVYLHRGQVYLQLGQGKTALEDFQRSLQLKPNLWSAKIQSALALSLLGEKETAHHCLNELVEQVPGLGLAHLYQAILAQEREDWATAWAGVEVTLRLRPHLPAAYRHRGDIQAALGHPQEATRDWEHVLHLETHSAEDYYQRGVCSLNLGDLDTAITALNYALWLNPNLAEAYGIRGKLHRYQGDSEAAQVDLDYALWLNPGWCEGYQERGIVLAQQGYWDAALADFEQWIRLSLGCPSSYACRSVAKFHLRKSSPEALEHPEHSEETEPLNDLEGLETIATAWRKYSPTHPPENFPSPLDFHPAAHRAQWREKLGDIAGAIEDWSQVLESLEPVAEIKTEIEAEIEDSPDSPAEHIQTSAVSLDQRIAAYSERGRLKRSLKDFPGSAADWREAARLLEEQGQEEEAQDILNQLSQGDEWGD